MKNLIFCFILTSLSFVVSAKAEDGCVHCEKKELISYKQSLLNMNRLAKELYNTDAYFLAKNICAVFTLSTDKKINIREEVLKIVKRRISKATGMKNPSFEQSLKYINKHKNSMMCQTEENEIVPFILYGYQDGKSEGYFFLEQIIDQTFYSEKNEDLILDVNAVTYNSKNNPETALDYLYNLSKEPNQTNYMKKAIKHAINLLKEYGGERYNELSEEKKRFQFISNYFI